jgi:N6-adenosine-specific RNA methylase IME4
VLTVLALGGAQAVKYRTVVADPPWAYRDKLRIGSGPKHKGADSQYQTMPLEEIKALGVGEWADSDAHLYLWVTNAFMAEGHEIAKAWGFQVRTILTWVKPRVGLGHYFRNNTEHVLFCVRGSLKTLTTPLRTAYEWPQGRHSEKPAAFYDLVEQVSPGPYLDVFARVHRFHWDAWGNEVYKPPHLETVP